MDLILEYMSPEKLTELAATWGTNVLSALVTLIVGLFIAGQLRKMALRALTAAKVDTALGKFLSNILRYIVIIAVLLAAAQSFGFEITSLMAIFASAGLAVGLALQGSLSHFAAGVMILFYRPFTINDVVTIGGETGKVLEIGLFATALMKVDGTKVTVPNSEITDSTILNHTILGNRRGTVQIGVNYGADLEKAKEVLLRAAKSVPEVAEDPAPAAVFVSFGASSLDFEVYIWAQPAVWWATLEKVKLAVYNELNAEGIEIPFAQMDINFRNALPKE